jgi:DNA-binding transcriptional regulator YiaG
MGEGCHFTAVDFSHTTHINRRYVRTWESTFTVLTVPAQTIDNGPIP